MQNQDIYNQFRSLSKEGDKSGGYTVIPIPDTNHKMGISVEGYPKFFIRTNDAVSVVSNTVLDILSVEYNLMGEYVDGKKAFTYRYTIITLHSLDIPLQENFIDIMILVLQHLKPIPTQREIAIEVENLISIFAAMACPPRKKIQGLWAELLVIEQSYNPDILIKAWHESPTAKYDFTLGRDKIEVKSCSSGTRVHHFSLEQLRPSVHSRVVIASVMVRESGGEGTGISVMDLYTKICHRVDAVDAQMYVYKVIAETIGSDIHRLNDLHFDYAEAVESIRFYNAKDVPCVDKDGVQPGVLSVGVTSDLSGIVDVRNQISAFNREGSPLYKSLYE